LDVDKDIEGSVTSFRSGEVFRYRIAYRCANQDPNSPGCGETQLVDALPPGLEVIEVQRSSHVIGRPNITGNVVTVMLDLTRGGETGIIYISARFTPGLQPDDPIFGGEMPIINEVTLDGTNSDPVSDSTPVTLLPGNSYSAEVTKSFSGTPIA